MKSGEKSGKCRLKGRYSLLAIGAVAEQKNEEEFDCNSWTMGQAVRHLTVCTGKKQKRTNRPKPGE